jgi:hypothetical protein
MPIFFHVANIAEEPYMSPRYEEDDYEEDDRRAPFPSLVWCAGVIWILFGCLMLINAGCQVVLTAMNTAAAGQQANASNPGATGAPFCGALFGIAFLFVGAQTVKGTAKDTLGNGIGSLVFGVLIGSVGALLVVAALALTGALSLILLIAGGINVFAGVGLLVAGILALAGREQYKAWRRGPRRRGDDDDR